MLNNHRRSGCGLAAAACCLVTSLLELKSHSELPPLVGPLVCLLTQSYGPHTPGRQLPQARLKSCWERRGGKRQCEERLVGNGTKQRSYSMKFICAYYLLPLFPALVFSSRWVQRAILCIVLLFCLLFILLDSVFPREIICISSCTRVVSLKCSYRFWFLSFPSLILWEILNLLLGLSGLFMM